jgi:hypothetical protein
VTANNGQPNNNSVTRTFNVTVTAVNQTPTLDPIDDLNIITNSGLQTVTLSGITSGAANENQTLKVTATSSNLTLITNLMVNYVSPHTNGTLTFIPVANAVGTATIMVTVNDGGKSNNIITQSFEVTISATTNDSEVLATTLAIKSASSINMVLPPTTVTPNSGLIGSSTSVTLTSAVYAGGQYSFYVSGVKDYQYIVEASSDMVNWTPVETNTAPFTYVETNPGQFSQRYYRTYCPAQ